MEAHLIPDQFTALYVPAWRLWGGTTKTSFKLHSANNASLAATNGRPTYVKACRQKSLQIR